jgi:hypothetical protein
MNPDHIYRQYRDDALARQITAEEYSTFVAMPFVEHYSYRSTKIYKEVIQVAAKKASDNAQIRRKFSSPKRIDAAPGVAGVVTEEIIVHILEDHLFLADLTFENPGVLLETGVALGLKPNNQIILILDGNPSNLHFDIRNNRVIRYDRSDAIDRISDALIYGANSFESDCRKYIESITRTLSSGAILCLNRYGQLRRNNPGFEQSLHMGIRGPHFEGADGIIKYEIATRELLQYSLLWTDYKVKAFPNGDAFGMHAIELGWRVIEHMWPELSRELIESM